MSDLFSCASCKYNDGQKCTMFGRVIGMHGCSNGEQRKPKTNGDKIRAMTDEELAVVIAWPYLASPPWCSEHTTCPYISEDPTPCDKCALDWLKQEVTTNSTT